MSDFEPLPLHPFDQIIHEQSEFSAFYQRPVDNPTESAYLAPRFVPVAPPEHTRTPVHQRVAKKLIAAGLAASLVGAGYEAVKTVETVSPHVSASAFKVGEMLPHGGNPITEDVPQNIQDEIARAVSVDKCETTVTTADVVDVYQRLFLTHEAPLQTLGDLRARTEQVANRLTNDKKEQGFIPLPTGFDRLAQDALGQRSIPVSEYEQMATAYLKQFNVTALFDWDQNTTSVSPKALANILATAEPLAQQGLDANKVIRSRIIDTMAAFANLPPSLVRGTSSEKAAPVQNIVFGNIVSSNALGLSDMDGTHTIYFDSYDESKESDQTVATNESYDAMTTPHEEAHQVYNTLCGVIAEQNASGHDVVKDGYLVSVDPAFESLNAGFTYGKTSVDALSTKLTARKDFVSLESGNPGEVVVKRPYGATDNDEDWATTLGELVFYAPATATLLSDSRDKHIIQEKVAYEIARIAQRDPAAAEYLIDRFSAARLQNKIYAASAPLSKAMNDRIQHQIITGNIGTGQAVDPTLKQIQFAYGEYMEIVSKLDDASGTLWIK